MLPLQLLEAINARTEQGCVVLSWTLPKNRRVGDANLELPKSPRTSFQSIWY